MKCEFIRELSKLKKSSRESVDNINEFDEFNKYMHITRDIEIELKEILKNVNNSNKKTLILLCGSAGDGKSHLLSYLKNSDEENLLDSYKIINDATESNAPNKTAIETLSEKLSEFNDENINYGNSKIILAINLGILSNFIDSEYANNFKELKKYVENSKILTGKEDVKYKENSNFQHITFSDYQMFSIKEKGIETKYLDEIFDKIFDDTDKNPFNCILKEEKINCKSSKYCPVRHNYEFLQNKEIRKSIINRIIEVIIKDKILISTRDILDFIYNIVVAINFNQKKLEKTKSDNSAFIEYYISCSLPMLIDEYKDISKISNYMKQYDILKTRMESLDEEAIYFKTIENIIPEFEKAIKDTPYKKGIEIFLKDGFNLENNENLKNLIFKFIKRLENLKNTNEIRDESLKEFIRFIYYERIQKDKRLKDLYKLVKVAIKKWNGFSEDEYICFDNSNDYYWKLEKIHLEPRRREESHEEKQEIHRFMPSIKLRYKNEIAIDIDFHLYQLMKNIDDGYNLTSSDKNFYADFNGFINKTIECGNKNKEVKIVSKNNPNNIITIKEDGFEGIEVICERKE